MRPMPVALDFASESAALKRSLRADDGLPEESR
jgi:hypothetical protein